jgi:hypothetical protein
MKILNYTGLDEWRSSSIVKQGEELSFKTEYECYQKASQILDTVEHFINTSEKTNLLDLVKKCEDMISNHVAFPVSICHPSIISDYEPEKNEDWKDLPYHVNISAQVNGFIVEREWTMKVNMLDNLLEKAINLISPGYSIQKWSEWLESELQTLKLYPINGKHGYELLCNKIGVPLPNKKHETSEEFKENSVYSVKIITKTSQENEVPLDLSTKCYTINNKRSNLTLKSSKFILKKASKRSMNMFCQRHVADVHGYQLGIKELTKKGLITGVGPLLLPTSHCISIGKTVLLKPTCKLVL